MADKNDGYTSCDFERKIEQLQSIVDKLESDGLSLEQSMALFESGLSITKQCVADLNGMQAKIEDLNGQLDLILRQSLTGGGDE